MGANVDEHLGVRRELSGLWIRLRTLQPCLHDEARLGYDQHRRLFIFSLCICLLFILAPEEFKSRVVVFVFMFRHDWTSKSEDSL